MNKKGDSFPGTSTVEPWAKSNARMKLYAEVASGLIDNLKAAEVQRRCVEYQLYESKQFASNLRNLRKIIKNQQMKAAFDKSAIENDLIFHHRKQHLSEGLKRSNGWHGSHVQKLLQDDIAAGKHCLMPPAELRKTRYEYMEISLKGFRGRIYQEKRMMLERPYWLLNKKRSSHTAAFTSEAPKNKQRNTT
jgi:hypothetical protein